jgi:hypothetical protein
MLVVAAAGSGKTSTMVAKAAYAVERGLMAPDQIVMLAFNREMLRNGGGVTDANLGRDSRAESGVAIGKQQDQGTLTTSDLPDNLRLARQLAGRLRLSHIEQFMTEPQVVRIVGDAKPIEWLRVNTPQEDGTVLNDIAHNEADFIIGEQNYRESFAQAAMESMMELLGKIGEFRRIISNEANIKALIRQEEEPISIAAIAEGSELEFRENKHQYGVKAIRNVGYGYWQHACLYTFT